MNTFSPLPSRLSTCRHSSSSSRRSSQRCCSNCSVNSIAQHSTMPVCWTAGLPSSKQTAHHKTLPDCTAATTALPHTGRLQRSQPNACGCNNKVTTRPRWRKGPALSLFHSASVCQCNQWEYHHGIAQAPTSKIKARNRGLATASSHHTTVAHHTTVFSTRAGAQFTTPDMRSTSYCRISNKVWRGTSKPAPTTRQLR